MPDSSHFYAARGDVADGSELTDTTTPDIGGFPMPARGVLAIGQAAWPILD